MTRVRTRPSTIRRARTTPPYADPWRFRRRAPVERAAGIDGRPLPDRVVRRGNMLVNAAIDEMGAASTATHTPTMLPELRRRVSAEIAKYRMSGLCSELDIALIESLWRDGKSMRGYAREREVSPAAIGDQIERLRYRCVRFYLFWLWKNRSRRRGKP